MAFQRFPTIPRGGRAAFYAGLAAWLLLINLAVVVVVYGVAADLPPVVAAGLLMLTPMYF
jgi:hypothetical protein